MPTKACGEVCELLSSLSFESEKGTEFWRSFCDRVSSGEDRPPLGEDDEEFDLPALNIDLNATHIQSSPYADPVNHLNLTELDLPYQLFAQALTHFTSIRTDYATAPYLESFNWSSVFALLRHLCAKCGVKWQRTEFYLVIFRSQLKVTADRTRLGLLDKNSHQEACESGGLLTYWFGSPDADMRNLATCELQLFSLVSWYRYGV